MSTQKVFQWAKENGALAFLLATQVIAIIGVFAFLAISTIQSMQPPVQDAPAVFAKRLPTEIPVSTDSQVISAQPAASEVK